VKDLLLNVGSGGGAAAAPAAGGAAAGDSGAAAAETKAEEKEEGMFNARIKPRSMRQNADPPHREGRVRRRHGIRSFRLSVFRKSRSLLRIYIAARQDAICGMMNPLTQQCLR
jgi:hypothetical protein